MPDVPGRSASENICFQYIHKNKKNEDSRCQYGRYEESRPRPVRKQRSAEPVQRQKDQKIADAEKDNRQAVGDKVQITRGAHCAGGGGYFQTACAKAESNQQRCQKSDDIVCRIFHIFHIFHSFTLYNNFLNNHL